MQVVINNVTDAKVQNAMTEISKAGGTVSGNNFNVKGVSGSYYQSGTELTIVITKKPFFYPESIIESELRKFFA